MNESEKIHSLEKRLAVLEESKRQKRWLWLAAAIVLPATLYAATTIPNTFSDGDVLSAEKLNANFAALANAPDPTPAGTIVAFAGTTAPAGWLICNGATISRSTYATLFATTGTAFGTGDGSSTFHLPDFRGRFLRGLNSGTGRDPDSATRTAMNSGGNAGDTLGSLQIDDFKTHRHRLVSQPSIASSTILHLAWAIAGSAGAGGAQFFTDTNNTGQLVENTGGNETRPVNAYVNYIIKH